MATTQEQLIHDLHAQIERLQQQVQPKRRRTFAERFRADLQRDEVPGGYRAVHSMMMREVGDDLATHISQHGFDLTAYAAVMKAYYSREGREVRAR